MSFCKPGIAGLPRRTVLLGLLGGLSGCGFQPLFRKSSSDRDLTALLHSIEIGPIPDRVGQRLHNALHDALTPHGPPQAAAYRLDVSLEETRSALAILRDASPTLTKLRLVARYQLAELATGRTIYEGRSESTTVFKIVKSEFANISARTGAQDRTAVEIADDMRTKLAVFLRGYRTGRN